MEKEIEKLKQEYLNTPIPKSLEQRGFSDVLSRMSITSEKPHQFYYSQIFGIMVLIVLLFTGFVGFAQASKPGTPLYPVKKLTANVLSKVTGKTPENIEKEINKILDIKNPAPTPIPKIQTLPKETESPKDTKEKETEKTNESEKGLIIEKKTDNSNEKVDGISTTKENEVLKNIQEHEQRKERED